VSGQNATGQNATGQNVPDKMPPDKMSLDKMPPTVDFFLNFLLMLFQFVCT